MGRRRRPNCPGCGNPKDAGNGYCRVCHAAYMRNWRKTHPLTPEQRFKDNARSYANVYKQRGFLRPKACGCGSNSSEMHHPDYAQPLRVEWFCRPCHLALHKIVKRETIL